MKMDEFRKRLEENAEEAEFALMLDDLDNEMEEELRRRYEDAKRRGEAPDMPEDMKDRLHRFILEHSESETAPEDAADAAAPAKSTSTADARRPHKWLRRLGVAAATIAILFCTMFTVQAMGIDVFGAIAQWTDSIFHFHMSGSEGDTALAEDKACDRLRYAMLAQKIDAENIPTWLPERFKITDIQSDSQGEFYTVAAMFSSEQDEQLIFSITSTTSEQDVYIEKSDDPVEIIDVNGKQFHLFRNADYMTAVWSDGQNEILISGNIEAEEMKEILRSIGTE